MIVDRVLNAYPREVLRIHPGDTVVEVAGLFEKTKTGLAIVCDQNEQVVGVVSLGDVVRAIGHRHAEALDLPVRMVMTSDVAICQPSDDIESALNKMAKRGVRHLPVVENGKLRGLIEKSAALQVLYEEAALDFAQLRSYVFKTGGPY